MLYTDMEVWADIAEYENGGKVYFKYDTRTPLKGPIKVNYNFRSSDGGVYTIDAIIPMLFKELDGTVVGEGALNVVDYKLVAYYYIEPGIGSLVIIDEMPVTGAS